MSARTVLMFLGTVAWSGLGAVLYAHFDLVVVFVLMTFALAIGLFAIESVLADTGTVGGFAGATGGAALGVAMMIFGADTVSDCVLEARGTVIAAVVAGKTVTSSHDGATTTYRFVLRHDDGSLVFGELHGYHAGSDLNVGDRVTAIEDPGRLVGPKLPRDVHPTRDAFELGALALALAVAFAWAAVCDERARRATGLGGAVGQGPCPV